MAKKPSLRGSSSALRAAAYIRLSIMTEETNSPDTQFKDIKRRIDAQEWHFDKAEAIVDQATGTKIAGGDLFVDLGISGSKGKFRPGYEALMKELDNYDRVVVWKIDRLTRRLSELGDVLDLFKENKVVLVGVSDGVDTATSAGRTTAELLGTIAGAEARNTSDRVSAAQQTMLRNGKWRGGPAPYGYRVKQLGKGKGSTLELDPSQAKHMKFALERFLKGDSIPAICNALNAKGVVSVFGNPWSHPALRRLIGSPAMAGFQVWKKQIVVDDDGVPVRPYPGIIDLRTYNRVQESIKKRYFIHPSRGGALLSGITYCSLCGGKMIGASPTEHGGANYRCRNRYQLNKACQGLSTRSKGLEGYVTEVILTLLGSEATRKELSKSLATVKKQSKSNKKDDPKIQHEFLRNQLRTLQARKMEKKYEYAGGEDDFEKAWEEITSPMKFLEEEMKKAPKDDFDPKLESLISSSDLTQTWQRMTVAERREIVGALIKKVTIMPRDPKWNNGMGYDPRRVNIEWAWESRPTNKPITNPAKKAVKRTVATKVRAGSKN